MPSTCNKFHHLIVNWFSRWHFVVWQSSHVRCMLGLINVLEPMMGETVTHQTPDCDKCKLLLFQGNHGDQSGEAGPKEWKTLHYCCVLRMKRKAVGPSCCTSVVATCSGWCWAGLPRTNILTIFAQHSEQSAAQHRFPKDCTSAMHDGPISKHE